MRFRPSQQHGRVSDWRLFLAKFLQKGVAIGAVTPSSPWMARHFLEGIALAEERCVVELGAGTGAITGELLRGAGVRCRSVIVERDPDFCQRLREHFPQADIAEADACDLDSLLAERGIDRVDHVLCGIALPWLNPRDRHRLLDSARRHLAPDGSFRQLSYMPWIHAGEYRRYFRRVTFRFVLRNIPPGGFYLCQSPVTHSSLSVPPSK
jgi:phosphatidylethanolamine/phosphatidyl-N-methylethanolamine N-methyltransferase